VNYSWLDHYCCSKLGVEKDFKEEWNATCYMLNGKMFALQGNDKSSKAIITLKLEPSHGQLLREEYEDIIPGYYMNKEHWNSVYLDGDTPEELLREMIDESYALIFKSLSKREQKDISGN